MVSVEFVAKEIWSKAVETCIANDCYRILGVANTTKPVSIVDGYYHNELFRDLGIDSKYRIAWVEMNKTVIKNYEFIETVLVNRGLPGRVFKNIEEAKNWLFDDRK